MNRISNKSGKKCISPNNNAKLYDDYVEEII